MKHLKKYEDNITYKFDIGEKVVCINDNWPVDFVDVGKTYTIMDRKEYNEHNFYSISNKKGEIIYNPKKLPAFFGEKVFATILEYDTMKYNL